MFSNCKLWIHGQWKFLIFSFLLIGLVVNKALLPTAWCFKWGFSQRYMDGGWANGKRTQWLKFLILRKTERMAKFVKGKGESEWKRLCVCNSGDRSMVRGLAEARSPLSFSVSFTVSPSPLSFPHSFSVSS